MPRRSHAMAFVFSSLATVAAAFAQQGASGPAVMEAEITYSKVFTIARVDPDGTILMRPSSNLDPQQNDGLALTFAEGYYLLWTTDSSLSDRHRLLRVQVTDVADGSEFTLRTGALAAARVHERDFATLVRPLAATTAKLRALPDEILIERSSDEKLDARELEARKRSMDNLRQIALAVHNFHATYDKYPPAVIRGPDDKPWHSCAVLLLPYLEHKDLYNAYDFSQPWDSPKNKALIDKMPSVYRDPIYGDDRSPYTNYAALVGLGAIFRPDGAKQTDPRKLPLDRKGVSLPDVADGTSWTLIVAPVEPRRKIPWTKPEDISVGPAFTGIGQPEGIAAPFTFVGPGGGKGAPLLFADGSVRMVGASIERATLSALISCAGGEIINADGFPVEAPPRGGDDAKRLRIRTVGRKITAVVEARNPVMYRQPRLLGARA